MGHVATYLNFSRETAQAFEWYKQVFRSEFEDGGIMRFGDMPPMEGVPPVPEEDKNLVMHVTLPILNGAHHLMGTDAPDSMGFTVNKGNNVHISLSPGSKEECDRLFQELSAGGKVTMPLQDTFWGAYFGSCTDQFGIHWMFNFDYPKA